MHKPCIVPYFSSILISRIFISLSHHTALKISKYNFLYPIVLGKTQVGFCFIYASFPANPFCVFLFLAFVWPKRLYQREGPFGTTYYSLFNLWFNFDISLIASKGCFFFCFWNPTPKKCHKRNQIKKKVFLWNYPLFLRARLCNEISKLLFQQGYQ